MRPGTIAYGRPGIGSLVLASRVAVTELVGERWMGRAPAELGPGPGRVRSLVIDVLWPEQLRRLGLVADRIMSRIDTSEINYPMAQP